jgi:hypothetical protein
MNAIDYRTHVNEVHGHIHVGGRECAVREGAVIEVRMPPPRSPTRWLPHGRSSATRRRTAMMKPETMEALEGIAHGSQDFEKSPALTGAERGEQFATRSVIKIGQIDRAVALVAQDFDERGPALFGRGLELAVNDAQ